SIKKSLEKIDLQAMCETAVACYVSTIQSIENHTVTLQKDLARRHKQRLKEIRRGTGAADINPETLRESAAALDLEIKNYADEVDLLAKQKQRDIREILAILADAAETLSSRDNAYSHQLRDFAKELEAVTRSDD